PELWHHRRPIAREPQPPTPLRDPADHSVDLTGLVGEVDRDGDQLTKQVSRRKVRPLREDLHLEDEEPGEVLVAAEPFQQQHVWAEWGFDAEGPVRLGEYLHRRPSSDSGVVFWQAAGKGGITRPGNGRSASSRAMGDSTGGTVGPRSGERPPLAWTYLAELRNLTG